MRIANYGITLLIFFTFLITGCQNPFGQESMVRPGHKDWPAVWTSFYTGAYRQDLSNEEVYSQLDHDMKDVKSHHVDMIEVSPRTIDHARMTLELARKHGLKLQTVIAYDASLSSLENWEEEPAYAIMNAGVYRGKAIDRHVYSFSPGKHEIILEPPVYNRNFAYVDRTGLPIVHYLLGVGEPLKAEVIVPLKEYDGSQHIEIIPATIVKAPPGSLPEDDSAPAGMQDHPEIKNRSLYQLSFDLSGFENAMLDKVGLAVYWNATGFDGTFHMMRAVNVALADETSKRNLQGDVQRNIAFWTEANNGVFPDDMIFAARYGDECFYLTSQMRTVNDHPVNIPLWDFSESFVSQYHTFCNEKHYPRTWGFPEIYGTDAYAWWLFLLHKTCAELVDVVKDELDMAGLNILLFRNTTRNGVFELSNEFDASGQEILAQKFDILHLDPYVVFASGYNNNIVRDMSYFSGLARRYDKPIVPWVQACTDVGTLKNQGGMRHPTPEQMVRMIDEHKEHGVDGIKWFGYGPGRYTYPDGNPETWKKAAEMHLELKNELPPKPVVKLAVIRPYSSRALWMYNEGQVRNPADYLLQQFLEVWAVKHRQPYDVFEVFPGLNPEELKELKKNISEYPYIVSTVVWDGAKIIGENTNSTLYNPSENEIVREDFDRKIREWGWVE